MRLGFQSSSVFLCETLCELCGYKSRPEDSTAEDSEVSQRNAEKFQFRSLEINKCDF
jgi:hypothetical protein